MENNIQASYDIEDIRKRRNAGEQVSHDEYMALLEADRQEDKEDIEKLHPNVSVPRTVKRDIFLRGYNSWL